MEISTTIPMTDFIRLLKRASAHFQTKPTFLKKEKRKMFPSGTRFAANQKETVQSNDHPLNNLFDRD